MQNKKGGFRVATPERPKEQTEYDETAKAFKFVTAKLRLAQQGVDTSLISRQELDRVMALYDKMDAIAADVRNKTTEIQRESNNEIQRLNQKANEKYSQVSKDIDTVINKMKKVERPATNKLSPVAQGDVKEEMMQEISPEKIKEDIINSFTERVMQKVRKEVTNTFEDYMNMLQKAPSPQIAPAPQIVPGITIGPGIVNKEAAKEIALKAGQDMIEKSAKVDPGDRPSDSEIPVITPEMIKKTEGEITKRINEKIEEKQ